ncbi:hypothetical protein MMC16_001459 [Acarospora aff. strigata]|nr:hypothetical protein [Acarospora aff. strigata]
MSLTFALQALLIRHETYMAEAEAERSRMAANNYRLVTDNKQLEVANTRIIEENRIMLNQLEDLNRTVTESSTQINSLTATLASARHELQRITVLAGRAAQLEEQLLTLEREQEQLQQELATTKEDERSATRRCKIAERTIGSLQQQVDRIEQEAREERERHAEVVERLGRRRAVERELENAAGRLKGAAATSGLGIERNGGSVVSHFVADILQDNANLQIGIVELREMLLISNEEVESLRERMVLHQPVVSDNEDGSQNPNLNRELGLEKIENGVGALHVHHHYHSAERPGPSVKEKNPVYRRSKRKRNLVSPSSFASLRASHSCETSASDFGKYAHPTAAATILSQTSVTIPPAVLPNPRKVWSIQSDKRLSSYGASSVPSSPQSAFRDAIFDRNDLTMDSSRPTSPESNMIESPMLFTMHRNQIPDLTPRSYSTPAAFQLKTQESRTVPPKLTPASENYFHNGFGVPKTGHAAILEEEESSNPPEDSSTPDPYSNSKYSPIPQTRPIHHSTSHESLLSVSGMDIHTLRSRPSQLLNLHRHPLAPQRSLVISQHPTGLMSSEPVLSATTAVARPAHHHPRRGYDKNSSNTSQYNRSHSLLSNIANTNNTISKKSSFDLSPSETSPTAGAPGQTQTLGSRVGGWVFGKWGVAPVTSNSTGQGQRYASAKAALAAVEERASGVGGNRGASDRALRQFALEKEICESGVRATKVDRGLLRESLGELKAEFG